MKNMMKYMFLVVLMLLLNINIINAKELTCKYNFYDSEGKSNWYANCTFDSKKKKYSCTMNFYYNKKEKTKSAKIVNFTISSGELSYSEDNSSAENKIFSSGKCPDYMIGLYTKNKKNGKNTNLYVAENETVKDRIVKYWYDKGSSYSNDNLATPSNTFLTAMKEKNVTTDEDSLNKIYDQIETEDDSNSGDDYINGCGDLPKTTALVKQIYGLIKYLIPVLVIGLSIVDFLKVLLSGEEKVYKDAWSKFVKRIIIGIVILLLPILLKMVINISGVLDDYNVDGNNIFCILS